MRRLALSLAVFVLATGTSSPARPAVTAGHARQASPSRPASRYAFPGGGKILFSTGDQDGFGIVDSNGTLRTFALARRAFPYWDPAREDQVLLLPFSDHGSTRALRIQGDRLVQIGSWRTPEGPFILPSLDGRFLASWVFASNGHLQAGARIVDRSTGRAWMLSSTALIPRSWTPDGRMIATAWQPHHPVKLWDPVTGETTPFPAGRDLDLSGLSWTPRGRRFAALRDLGTTSEIVLGAASGRVVRRIPLTRRPDGVPTWSPDGGRLAFLVPGPGKDGYIHAALHVFDRSSGADTVVAEDLPDAWWASWSPDGRWLLVAGRARWLFIAADGSAQIRYPSLGAFPRWYGPSSPSISIQIPVC